jgi:hypothetical protein
LIDIPEFIGQGNQVRRFIAGGEINQRIINPAMGISVKVFRGENLQHFIDGIIFDEDISQYGLLCLHVLGRKLMRGDIQSIHSALPRP